MSCSVSYAESAHRIDYNALKGQSEFDRFIVSYSGPYDDDGRLEHFASELNRVEDETGLDFFFERKLATGGYLIATSRKLGVCQTNCVTAVDVMR